MSDLVKPGKRALIFDGDGARYIPGDSPCTLCGTPQEIDTAPRVFIRVREKLAHGTREVALLCPDCIARAVLQVERLSLWRDVSGAVRAAIQRMIAKRRKRIEP